MAKIAILTTALIFAFGFLIPNAVADEQAAGTVGKPSAFSSMVGTSVLNAKGEYLGRISDFVIDSQGQVTFAVVSHGGFLGIGGQDAAVPYGSFSYDRQKGHFVLDVTRDKLNMAPAFTTRDLYNEKWAEDVYRYFGRAPYWTEGELVEEGIKPPEETVSDFGGIFNPYQYSP